MSLLRSSIPRSLTRQVQLSASTSQIRHNSSTRDGPDAKHLTPSRAAGSRDVAQEQKDRETNPLQASLISDAPPELTHRAVRIFKPAKTANSSGKAGTASWRVDFDILQGSARWENPLMGWASSGDYMQGTFLKFRSLDDAIHFCSKQGWDYFVQKPHAPRIPPKSYASNYDYVPASKLSSNGKLRIHHTK